MKRDFLLTASLVVLAGGAAVFAWQGFEGNRSFAPVDTGVPDVDINDVADRVISFHTVGTGPDARVEFTYTGDSVPEKIKSDEVTELRKENSYTRYLATVTEGKDPIVKMNTVFYTQNVYTKQNDGWHYIERGKTSAKEFEHALAMRTEPRLIETAYADTNTYTPVIQEYTYFSGDGSTQAMDPAWATTHAATASSGCLGGGTDYVSQNIGIAAELTTCIKSSEYLISRAFIPFDTRMLPPSATVSAATLNMYVYSVIDLINDSVSYITVVQSSQASSTKLVDEDYDQDGAESSPTEGVDTGQRKDLTSISTSAYLSFTLNSTGRGWIKRQGDTSNCGTARGVSCFGIREGHDTTNTTPTNLSIVSANSAEAGVSTGPYLSVTYTTPASELVRGLRLSQGQVIIYGGTLQILPK